MTQAAAVLLPVAPAAGGAVDRPAPAPAGRDGSFARALKGAVGRAREPEPRRSAAQRAGNRAGAGNDSADAAAGEPTAGGRAGQAAPGAANATVAGGVGATGSDVAGEAPPAGFGPQLIVLAPAPASAGDGLPPADLPDVPAAVAAVAAAVAAPVAAGMVAPVVAAPSVVAAGTPPTTAAETGTALAATGAGVAPAPTAPLPAAAGPADDPAAQVLTTAGPGSGALPATGAAAVTAPVVAAPVTAAHGAAADSGGAGGPVGPAPHPPAPPPPDTAAGHPPGAERAGEPAWLVAPNVTGADTGPEFILPGGPPRPAPLAAAEPLLDQVARALYRVVSGGEGDRHELHLQLWPRQLGELSVRLVLDGGQVTADIVVTRPEAKLALESGFADLRQRLQELGVAIDGLQVAVGGGSDAAADQRRQPGPGVGRRVRLAPVASPAEAGGSAAVASPAPWLVSAGWAGRWLDSRV